MRVAAILADPSSSTAGGALLGDRIRMSQHNSDPDVFIRSLADRGHGGGLPAVSSEVVELLTGSDFDVVAVETVGVGQSERAVIDVCDCTILVYPPGAGDAMQAMKSGILEQADILVVNKADAPGADRTRQDLENSQRMRGVTRPVLMTSAQDGAGVAELISALETIFTSLETSGELRCRREKRLLGHVYQKAAELWTSRLANLDLPAALRAQILSRQLDPRQAALVLSSLVEGVDLD